MNKINQKKNHIGKMLKKKKSPVDNNREYDKNSSDSWIR